MCQNVSFRIFKQYFIAKENDSVVYQETLELLTSEYYKCLMPKVQADSAAVHNLDLTGSIISQSYRTSDCMTQWLYLCRRTFLNQVRNPLFWRARIFSTIFMALLVLSVFWDLGYDSKGIQGKIGLFFFFCTNMVFSPMFGVLMTFLNERAVFLREYSNKTYGVLPYYFAKIFVELPFLLLVPVMFASIVYFGVGLTAEFGKFCIFCLIM